MIRLAIHGGRDYTQAMEWNDRFMQVFTDAVCRFHEQTRVAVDQFFLPEEKALLEEIGYSPHEMYDYVKDYATLGEPSPSTVLLIAAVRRSFFVMVQRCIAGSALLNEADIPRESEEYQDIAYLPRIIRKAEAKLYGTLPRSVMYYCAKDRNFLRKHGDIHPADFLDVVWTAKGNKQMVVSYVLRVMKEKGQLAQLSAREAPEQENSAGSNTQA